MWIRQQSKMPMHTRHPYSSDSADRCDGDPRDRQRRKIALDGKKSRPMEYPRLDHVTENTILRVLNQQKNFKEIEETNSKGVEDMIQ